MTARWIALAQRIRLETEELERTVSAIARHWQCARRAAEDQDAFLNSVALNLHGFYNGLERVMELVALEIDGGTLGGETWHAELLRQMALEVPSVRPAMLSADSGRRLDEYRKFRHRVRHIYAAQLNADLMEHLVEGLSPTWEQLRAELLAFADFLEQLA